MPDLVEELRRRIEEAGDPARAARMRAYMKSELPFRGVPAAPLRAITREVVVAHPLRDRGAWEAAVRRLWDVVDHVASHLVGDILAADRAGVTPAMRAWAVDEDLWLRRSAVLCQLRHGARSDTDLLRDVLTANLEDSPHGGGFWIRKAVGWSLRQHARTDPGWVRRFVEKHDGNLSGLSRREALKHLATTHDG